MRIAMIGSRGLGSNYGGIERVLDHLCPALAARGHRVDVFSREDALHTLLGASNIPVPAVGGKHFENLSRSVRATFRAVGRYDLLHFHAVGPGLLSAIARLEGQRSVVTIHGLDQRRDKWGRSAKLCLSMAEQVLVRNATAVSVVSEPLRRYLLERYDRSAAHIPNGVARVTPVAAGPVLAEFGLAPKGYVLYASRLVPEKGCHDLIRAFNEARCDLRLVIAGTAPDLDYVASLRALADPTRVVFTGHRTGAALEELFSNAYLFVLPSSLEGMSMALIEALSFGVLPVVSDIPENRVVTEDRAVYFPVGDVAAIRRHLEALAAAPSLVERLAARLAELPLPDWENVASRYERLYRTALAPRPSIERAAVPQPAFV